jgi:hypothetical protein
MDEIKRILREAGFEGMGWVHLAVVNTTMKLLDL